MRQIYNVESPPSSMLYDTSAISDGLSIQNCPFNPNTNANTNTNTTTTTITTPHTNPSPSSTSSDIATECCNRLQEFTLNGYLGNVVKQHQQQRQQQQLQQLQLQQQQQQASPSKSIQLKSNNNSPSRLSLANLMPSRLAFIFSRFLLFSILLVLSIYYHVSIIFEVSNFLFHFRFILFVCK